jgi:hypothetical protein
MGIVHQTDGPNNAGFDEWCLLKAMVLEMPPKPG